MKQQVYFIILFVIGATVTGVVYANHEEIFSYSYHLGHEVYLCEKNIGQGWDRSPYNFLRCSYVKSSTSCLINETNLAIIKERIQTIENIGGKYTITTVGGYKFTVDNQPSFDDIITIQKTWNTFTKTYKVIASDEQVTQWAKLFANEKIELEPIYYYDTDWHPNDGNMYAESWSMSESTPEYRYDFCGDMEKRSMEYKMVV